MMCAARDALRERTRAAEALIAACRAQIGPISGAMAPALAEPVPRELARLARRIN